MTMRWVVHCPIRNRRSRRGLSAPRSNMNWIPARALRRLCLSIAAVAPRPTGQVLLCVALSGHKGLAWDHDVVLEGFRVSTCTERRHSGLKRADKLLWASLGKLRGRGAVRAGPKRGKPVAGPGD